LGCFNGYVQLNGKVALVTGAAKRIGREIALDLARAGAIVAITYNSSQREAEATTAAIGKLGTNGLAIRCDVRDEENVRETIAEVTREFKRLDILVNNAAIYQTAEFEQITTQQFDDVFATNTRGPFFFMKYSAPELRRRRGRIINIGSLGGLRPWSTHAHYCSSKAALHMLTHAAAKALAPEISVNCVAPGVIDFGERDRAVQHKRFAAMTPMGTTGKGSDIAAAVHFFATCPHFITGQILAVDGGLSLK
jgi:NAD(P)-dependent dehydrogenase (short-subunit alcohol dehydrogenase family)